MTDPTEAIRKALDEIDKREDPVVVIASLLADLDRVTRERDEARRVLRLARSELAGLPHSLGYSFTHLPAIDAALGAEGG